MGASFIPFTAQTRMSGVRLPDREIIKGAAEAVETYLNQLGSSLNESVRKQVERVSQNGETALVVVESKTVLGVIRLKDIIEGGYSRTVHAASSHGN